MSEMGGFEKAFQNAIDYSNKHKDTLVVATADHSTGGLSIAKGKITYGIQKQFIK